jgi:hypothetical protein
VTGDTPRDALFKLMEHKKKSIAAARGRQCLKSALIADRNSFGYSIRSFAFASEWQRVPKPEKSRMSWFSRKWTTGVLRKRVFPPFGRGFSRHGGLPVR